MKKFKLVTERCNYEDEFAAKLEKAVEKIESDGGKITNKTLAVMPPLVACLVEYTVKE